MKQLGQSAIGTGSGTLIYTVPTGMETDVQDFMLANTGSVAVSVSLHFVPSGGSATTSNSVMSSVDIPGNTSIHWCGNQHMTAGGFIQAIGSASGLTITVSGTELRKGGAL